MDILVASSFNDVIRYFHNQGNFSFESAVYLPGTWADLDSFEVADLNNDGTPDMVTVDLQLHKLLWQTNTNGIFSEPIVINGNLTSVGGRILCHDYNGDGTIDIVVLNHLNVLLFLNDGLGNFTEPQNLLPQSQETEIYDNVAGYFNDDDFLDIAIATDGFQILLNDGNGNFVKTIGGGSPAISLLLESADYNNDGLTDVLMDAATLRPFLNSPNGFSNAANFTPNNENYQTLFSADLDNDGDLDVLSEDNQTNALFWYENVNQATSWIRHTLSITNSFSTIYGVSAADLDGDGDNDLIRTSGNGEVAIYENQTILGVKQYASSNCVLFPNPASNYFALEGTNRNYTELAIYDLLGKKIKQYNDVNNSTQFDVSQLASGNYLIKLITNTEVSVKRLFVKH